jgi:hypothetical protein
MINRFPLTCAVDHAPQSSGLVVPALDRRKHRCFSVTVYVDNYNIKHSASARARQPSIIASSTAIVSLFHIVVFSFCCRKRQNYSNNASMNIRSLLFSALLAIGAAAQSSCTTATNCASCTGLGDCGWCTYSGTCQSGNQTGSFTGCTTPYWYWTTQSCPATPAPTANCAPASSCLSCTQLGGCGWCAFSNQCQSGNATASFQGCVAPYWSWTNSQCMATPAPTANCAVASSCLTCTQLGGCGWCAFTTKCESGNSTGSFVGCVSPYWSWTNNQCGATPAPHATPAPVPTPTSAPNTCGAYNNNCAQCTAQGICGYCLTTGVCEAGTGSGSNNGNCITPDWAWTNQQCSVIPTPIPGNSPSPSSTPAPGNTPAPSNSPMTACNQFGSSCVSCTNQAGCGFCTNSNVCESGTATNSNDGDCSGPSWIWFSSECGNATQSN